MDILHSWKGEQLKADYARNCIKQSSSEANSCLGSQEIPRLSRRQKAHDRFQTGLVPVPSVS
jgi:hypothetical protein